jgi:carbon monoxide dehydrogenase subunit G
MDINGSHQFNAAPQQVWNALMNPEVLKSCIPGAQTVEVTTTSVTVTATINTPLPIPGLSGKAVTGGANIVEQSAPSHAVLAVDRSGSYGSIKGQVAIDLAPAGAGTTLTYNGHFDTGGMLGMVPGGVVKGGLDSFFKSLESKV